MSQFEILDKPNTELDSQNKQMVELGLDFSAMVLNREESKKTLQAKFDDLQKCLFN